MNKQEGSIDLTRLVAFILQRIWLVVICAVIGFSAMYWYGSRKADTYTAFGTMFVTNSNPNLINYGYTSSSDIYSAVSLVGIYTEVIKSETVMRRILEYPLETLEKDGVKLAILLGQKYPILTTEFVREALKMESVNETPIVKVSCKTEDPQMSADICNSILQVAPQTLKEVVGAGDAKPQDYADVPQRADKRFDLELGAIGGLAGIVIVCGLLTLLFLTNRKVDKPGELINNYTPPILSYIPREKADHPDPGDFLLSNQSEMDVVENYAKLRMNLIYAISQKKSHTFLVTSSISGEGKSTIAANLAISFSFSGKKVLLIDADMRRACLGDIFHYDPDADGLSDILIGNAKAEKVIRQSKWDNLHLLPAGSIPPNPSELLQSPAMHELLEKLEEEYDLILIDVPPINIVADPLALSEEAAGALFVVRQHYSDHREIKRALIAAEGPGLEILGFAFHGEDLHQGSYYGRRAYSGYKYYHSYDIRKNGNNEKPVL